MLTDELLVRIYRKPFFLLNLGQIAADMPLVPPPLVKPTVAAIAVIRAVVKGPQHMLLKDASAPRSANPIATAARAYQSRGLALIHDVAVSQGHSNWW
jgi:hypothetical protein